MHLLVPVKGLLADTTGRLAGDVEPVRQVGDRVLDALGDGCEVLLVAGDQGGSALAARRSGRSNALVARASI